VARLGNGRDSQEISTFAWEKEAGYLIRESKGVAVGMISEQSISSRVFCPRT